MRNMKFRKKPVIVEAFQFNGELKGPLLRHPGNESKAYIETLEGRMFVGKGDWIIQGVKGEFYPCKPDIFEATYELVEEPPCST